MNEPGRPQGELRNAQHGSAPVSVATVTVHAVEVDHLVVAARNLAEGAAWCADTLGIAPDPGGRHDGMGTHNRLLNITSDRYPRAYLEIIALDPGAPAPRRTRWFDLDQAILQAALINGPRLIHWVARCGNVQAACDALRTAGIDRGAVVQAQRQTPYGMLQWKIALRDDGQRLFDGALPTLIEWGASHPTDKLPHRGVTLDRLNLSGLPRVFQPWLPPTVALVTPDPSASPASGATSEAHTSPMRVTLSTPRGAVTLESLLLAAAPTPTPGISL